MLSGRKMNVRKLFRKNWYWLFVAVPLLYWMAVSTDSGKDASDAAADSSDSVNERAGLSGRDSSPDQFLDLAKLDRKHASPGEVDLFPAKPAESVSPADGAASVPLLPFAYVGKMVDNGTTTVFLTGQGQDYRLRLHEVVDGIYRVEEINDSYIAFTYLPLNLRQMLVIGQ